jgi:hypothetical protein
VDVQRRLSGLGDINRTNFMSNGITSVSAARAVATNQALNDLFKQLRTASTHASLLQTSDNTGASQIMDDALRVASVMTEQLHVLAGRRPRGRFGE